MKNLIQSIRERYKPQAEAFPAATESADISDMGTTGTPGGNVRNQKNIVGDEAKQAMKKKKFEDAAATANRAATGPGERDAIKKLGVKEEIDFTDVDETIIYSPVEYDISEASKNYDAYFRAKMKGRNLGSMSPEEKKKFFKDVDAGYHAKNEDVFLEQAIAEAHEDVKAAHRKAGNKISHETSSTRDGQSYHSFVVTQPSGKRTRHVYHGTKKRVETMSPAARSKESQEQDLDDKD